MSYHDGRDACPLRTCPLLGASFWRLSRGPAAKLATLTTHVCRDVRTRSRLPDVTSTLGAVPVKRFPLGKRDLKKNGTKILVEIVPPDLLW